MFYKVVSLGLMLFSVVPAHSAETTNKSLVAFKVDMENFVPPATDSSVKPSQALSEQNREPELLIFVSFSMPKESLKAWAEQAKRANGTLLLRGFFENSLAKTTAKTLEVFGREPDVDIAIDPERFQQFDIQAVPAVVITQPASKVETTDGAAPPLFDVVYGDASLEASIEQVSKTGSQEGQITAKRFLKDYREKK